MHVNPDRVVGNQESPTGLVWLHVLLWHRVEASAKPLSGCPLGLYSYACCSLPLPLPQVATCHVAVSVFSITTTTMVDGGREREREWVGSLQQNACRRKRRCTTRRMSNMAHGTLKPDKCSVNYSNNNNNNN